MTKGKHLNSEVKIMYKYSEATDSKHSFLNRKQIEHNLIRTTDTVEALKSTSNQSS